MNTHMVEETCEIPAFIKGDTMSGSEKDAGFCSGGDEDDMSGLHSPSASEDSVEVQVSPISLRNKRKLVEPRRVHDHTAPLKKRRFELPLSPTDEESEVGGSPFRPWSSEAKRMAKVAASRVEKRSEELIREQWIQVDDRRKKDKSRKHEVQIQQEVLRRLKAAEVQRAQLGCQESEETLRLKPHANTAAVAGTISVVSVKTAAVTAAVASPLAPPPPPVILQHPRLQDEPLALVLRGEVPRVPAHPGVNGSFERPTLFPTPEHYSSSLPHVQNHQTLSNDHPRLQQNATQQRNYKNMTRERRIEANARERTRVHTISAAFDTLRRSIPAYSHNQKLSKLSVLRIACSYIMTLSKIANTDGSDNNNSGPNLSACIDLVSRTIQTEGKLRKKKDD